MNIAIVSNLEAGIGLKRDFDILVDILTSLGHEVTGLQFDAPRDDPKWCELAGMKYHLAIFLEVIPLDLIDLAPVRYAFLNPEWCRPELIKTVERHIDKVFAKTIEAFRIFDPLWPGRVVYTGFTCRDQYDATIPRVPCFLHIGGNSSLRGSEAVADAFISWKKNGTSLDAKLVIVSRSLYDRFVTE